MDISKFRKMHSAALSPVELQAPRSCQSSCFNVLFPTAVVEYSIQTNQAELTALWLDGGSGSMWRIQWSRDTKIQISGLLFFETEIMVN